MQSGVRRSPRHELQRTLPIHFRAEAPEAQQPDIAPPKAPTAASDHATAIVFLGADGTTYKQYFTLDTDTTLLPEDLVIQGLRWRWKKEKGLDYAEDFRTYEMQVKDAIGRDGGKPTLHLDGSESGKPGVFVPAGSWLQP